MFSVKDLDDAIAALRAKADLPAALVAVGLMSFPPAPLPESKQPAPPVAGED